MNYRIITLTISMIGVALGCLAEQPADTVKVIENASNILVVAKDGKTVVDADFPSGNGKDVMHYQYEVNVKDTNTTTEDQFSDDWGMDLPFVKDSRMNVNDNKVRRYLTILRRAYWGWRFNYGGKGNVRNGWEVGMPDWLAVKWRRRGAEFEIGVGFTGSRYNAQDNFCYQKQGDRLMLAPVPDGLKVKETYLDIISFNFPLLYNQDIGKDFTFTFGAIVNLNTYATASTRLVDFDDRYSKTTYKGLQQNLFTVDAYASVSAYGIGFFAKWSPMKIFRPQFGPDLRGFTIGVEISLNDMMSF